VVTQPTQRPSPLRDFLYRLDERAYGALRTARETLARHEPRRLVAVGAAVVALPILGLAIWHWSRSDEPMTRLQLTTNSATSVVRGAAISPDGETLAYADADGLQLLTLETLRARTVGLADETRVEETAWSPDGGRVYFVGRRKGDAAPGLWALELAGGSPRRLHPAARQPAVSPDGTKLAFVQEQPGPKSIWIIDANGDNARAMADDERYDHLHPTWVTDDRLAFTRVRPDETGAEIVTRSLTGGPVVRAEVNFDPRTAPCWTPDGRLVFGRADHDGASLWSVRLDPESGEPEGPAMRIAAEPGVAYFAELSVDREGRRLGFVPVRTQLDSYVADLDRDAATFSPRLLRSGDGDHWPVAWTDEGESLLVHRKHAGQSVVLLQPVEGGGPRSVAPGRLLARTPDGAVLFEAAGQAGLMRATPPAGEPEFVGPSLQRPGSNRRVLRCPRRPGKSCVLAVETGNTLQFHVYDPDQATGRGRELARIRLDRPDYGWNVSADGGRVAVVNGGRTIKLVNLNTGGVRKFSIDTSVYSQGIAWDASGRTLYLSGMLLHSGGGHVLYQVDLSGKTRLLWRTADRWFGEPVPSPDGTRLALAARTVEANAWMLEHF